MFSGDRFKMIKNIGNRLSIKKNRHLPDRSNGDQYFYISNFEQATDKQCMDLDKLNEKIYINNIKIYNKTNKQLETRSMPFKLEKPPDRPPRPNNYENLLLWRRRNVKKNVQDQSIAIMYLLSKKYRIKYPGCKKEGVEPYEAIKLANQLAKRLDENIMEEVKKYQNNSDINSKNVSINSIEDIINKESNNNIQNNDNEQKDNDVQKNSNDCKKINNKIITRNISESDLIEPFALRKTQSMYIPSVIEDSDRNKPIIHVTNNMTIPQNEKKNEKMTCQNPEHHNLDDKIQYFDRERLNKLSLYPSLSEEHIPSSEQYFINRRNTIDNCNMVYPNTVSKLANNSNIMPSAPPMQNQLSQTQNSTSAPPPYCN